MMNSIRIIICFVFLFCNSIYGLAQFNTLRYHSSDKKETVAKNVEAPKPKEELKKGKGKNWLKQLFTSKSKTKLNSEIDSLKSLIIEKDKEHEIRLNKMQKSIETLIKKETSNRERMEKEKEALRVHMPLKTMFVTSPFGYRKISKKRKFHYGVDLRAKYEEIYAVMNGTVKEVGFGRRGGKYIKIAHSNKIETVYLHLSEIYYKEGDNVKAGWVIGKSGNTGNSTSPHLHFAVKENNKYLNPMRFLNQLIAINNIINLNKNNGK